MLKKYPLHFLFLLSLIIRICYALYLSPDIIVGDGKCYYDQALYFLGKAEYLDFKAISFWSPGVALYLLAWLFMLGTSKCAVVTGMLAVWAAFFYLFEKWASSFLQAKTRGIILLIFTIFPTFIHHSVVPLTHLPATTCILALFYFLDKKQAFSPIITGTLFGFLLLIRPSNLLLGLISPFLIQSKKQILFAFLTSFLILGTWSVYLYSNTQTFIFVSESNAYNLYMGNHPETPKYETWWWATHSLIKGSLIQREADSIFLLPAGKIGKGFQPLANHYIQTHLTDFAIRSLNRMRCLFAFDTFTGSMLAEKHSKYVAFAVIGIDGIFYLLLMSLFLLSFLTPNLSKSTIYFQISTIFLISFPYFFSFSHPTYHFSILPIVVIGAGLCYENRAEIGKNIPIWQKATVMFFLLLFILIQCEWLFFWIKQR